MPTKDKSPEPSSGEAKPAVWPSSAADLGIDEPPVDPKEEFTYLPDTAFDRAPGDVRNRVDEPTQLTAPPPQLGKQKTLAAPSFSAIVRVDGEVAHFDVSANGSADFVTRMVNSFADAFYAEATGAGEQE